MVQRMRNSWRRFADLHLTRPRRIFIDLLLTAVLALLAWQWYGYPLPLDMEEQFRQLEQKNLLGEREIVLSYEKLPGKTEPARVTKDLFADLGEDRVVLGYLDDRGAYNTWLRDEPKADQQSGEMTSGGYRSVNIPERWLEVYPRTEGVQVIPISAPVPNTEGKLGWAVLVTGFPENILGGTLTVGEQELEWMLPTDGRKSILFWLEDENLEPRGIPEDSYLCWDDLTCPWTPGTAYRLTLAEAKEPDSPVGQVALVQEGILPEGRSTYNIRWK